MKKPVDPVLDDKFVKEGLGIKEGKQYYRTEYVLSRRLVTAALSPNND